MVDSETVNLVREYLRKLRAKGLHISRAFVYGSRAKGTANEQSDIDLMLVSPLFDKDKDKYAGPLWLTAGEVSYKIEPIAIGEMQFLSDEYSPLIGIVKKEGVEVN